MSADIRKPVRPAGLARKTWRLVRIALALNALLACLLALPVPPVHAGEVEDRRALAEKAFEARDFAAAEREYRALADLIGGLPGREEGALARALAGQARALIEQKRHGDAEVVLNRALAGLLADPGRSHKDLATIYGLLAQTAEAQGRMEDAVRYQAEAVRSLDAAARELAAMLQASRQASTAADRERAARQAEEARRSQESARRSETEARRHAEAQAAGRARGEADFRAREDRQRAQSERAQDQAARVQAEARRRAEMEAEARARERARAETAARPAPPMPPPSPAPAVPATSPRPAPPAPEAVEVARYPTLEAPDGVAPDAEFEVAVSLTEDQLAENLVTRPGPETRLDGDGRLVMALPGGQAAWTIDVALFAPGFSFPAGPNFARIELRPRGDSTRAVFRLRAEAKGGPAEGRPRKIHATLTHRGQYIARITKEIAVGAAPAAPVRAAAVQAAPAAISTTDAAAAPDLTVFIMESQPGDPAGQTDVLIYSPWIQPVTEHFPRQAEAADWIALQYEKIIRAAGAGPSGPVQALMNGLGATLWDKFAPASVRQAFWKVLDQRGDRFRGIQIYTNNPALPWELMRPARDGGADRRDFLGTEFAIARWHVAGGTAQLERPPARQPSGPMIAIAPAYAGAEALPAQQAELAALRAMPGFRTVAGRWSALADLFGAMPSGIIHFMGHGEVQPGGQGVSDYRIKLEDAVLDVTSWRGLAQRRGAGRPFFFFNACEVGQAQRVANFVDGWAPAVLEAGGSGYIGGLWPLTDTASAAFSARFYAEVAKRLAGPEGTASIAGILRDNRRRFAAEGDPTWLAYVLYGDVNLSFVAPGR